jgi:hypothetical protein
MQGDFGEDDEQSAEALAIGQKHWVDPDRMDSLVCYPPNHGPDFETIVAIEINGNTALVTVNYQPTNGRSARLYEYHLTRCGETWKISRLLSLDPDMSISPDSSISLLELRFLNTFDPRGICNLDLSHAFKKGAQLHGLQGYEPVKVSEVGKISFPSGRMVVHDPGSLAGCEPLALKVPVGPHPVTISFTEHLVGAVRIHWGNLKEVIGYVPAQTVTENRPYIVSADVANVAFGDAEWILRMNFNQRDRLWNQLLESMQSASDAHKPHDRPRRRDLVKEEAHFVGQFFVSVPSGHGDGGYPCYQGINASGEPLCVVVDFHIYGENETHIGEMPYDEALEDGFLKSDFLDKHDLQVHLKNEPGRLVLEFAQAHSLRVQALDKSGADLGPATGPCEAHSSPEGMVSTLYLDLPEDIGALRFIVTRWRSDLEKGPDGKARAIDPRKIPYFNGSNTPSLPELVARMKAVPHLAEVTRIVESEEWVQPFRIRNLPSRGFDQAEEMKEGIRRSFNQVVGLEEAIRILKENGETLVVMGMLCRAGKLVVVYFEGHTGRLLTGLAAFTDRW